MPLHVANLVSEGIYLGCESGFIAGFSSGPSLTSRAKLFCVLIIPSVVACPQNTVCRKSIKVSAPSLA